MSTVAIFERSLSFVVCVARGETASDMVGPGGPGAKVLGPALAHRKFHQNSASYALYSCGWIAICALTSPEINVGEDPSTVGGMRSDTLVCGVMASS